MTSARTSSGADAQRSGLAPTTNRPVGESGDLSSSPRENLEGERRVGDGDPLAQPFPSRPARVAGEGDDDFDERILTYQREVNLYFDAYAALVRSLSKERG